MASAAPALSVLTLPFTITFLFTFIPCNSVIRMGAKAVSICFETAHFSYVPYIESPQSLLCQGARLWPVCTLSHVSPILWSMSRAQIQLNIYPSSVPQREVILRTLNQYRSCVTQSRIMACWANSAPLYSWQIFMPEAETSSDVFVAHSVYDLFCRIKMLYMR